MATVQLIKDELKFTNANSNSGSLSFHDTDKFKIDRVVEAPLGIISTGVNVGGASSITASTDFEDLTARTFNLKDASALQVTFQTPTSVTPYTLTIPSAQGAADSSLQNDGSGNLSWSSSFNTVTIKDSTTNTVAISAPTSVTSYTLKLPNAQGAAETFLKNDGSGNLSFGKRLVAYASMAGYNIQIGAGWNKFTALGVQAASSNVAWDNTNYGLKVAIAGTYRIHGFFTARNVDNSTNVEIKLFKNSTQLYHNYAFASVLGNTQKSLSGTVYADAAVNDIFYLWTYKSNVNDTDLYVDCANLAVELIAP